MRLAPPRRTPVERPPEAAKHARPLRVFALALGLVAGVAGPFLSPSVSLADSRDTAAPKLGPTDLVDRQTAALQASYHAATRAAGVPPADDPNADPVIADVKEWLRLRDAKQDDWTALSGFAERRPNWPGVGALRSRAEAVMPEGLGADAVARFFETEEPRTARGARLFGQAQIAMGRTGSGEAWIAEAWRNRLMPRAEENEFLSRHATLLSRHHSTRARMLFWRERLRALSRLAKHLPAGEQRLAAAKIALYRGEGGVDRLIAAVPEELRTDPALAFARMMWRAKRRQHDDVEQSILAATAAETLGEPGAWAKKRLFYAREAYEEGRPEDALALASNHGLTSGVDFADLQWFAGWMALRKLDEPEIALQHFDTMWRSVRTPISRGRAAFWAGEAAAAMNDPRLAAAWQWRAADHPNVFYGQLALERVRAAEPDFTPRRGAPRRPDLDAVEQSLIMAATTLYRLGETRDARRFLAHLAERRPTESLLRYATRLAEQNKDIAGGIKVAKIARGAGVDLWNALYPIPDIAEFRGRSVEAALLLALARQESAFQPSAKSSAGAIGLMQMMPRTARTTARRAGMPFDRRRLATDPDYNLTLADAHMRELLDSYDDSYVLSVAAYNAGGGNVRKWVERFGDPRRSDVNVVDWVESIPFSETRNYVQRVLEAVQVYRGRLGLAPAPVRLASDLTR